MANMEKTAPVYVSCLIPFSYELRESRKLSISIYNSEICWVCKLLLVV